MPLRWILLAPGSITHWMVFVAMLVLLPALAPAQDKPSRAGYIVDYSHSPHALLRPVPLEAVEWTTGFWAERYKQLAEVSLEESWRLLADPAAGHVLDNFRFAAKPGSGPYQGTTWQDEWLYKWIEAAACVWRTNRDPALLGRMDEAIALIAAAQQPDGYLSTMPLARQLPRFQSAQDHEVYNMGHLLTAGVIHHRMTGQENLLTVAKKTGDFLCASLGVTVKPYMAHNPSAIMGLVELYRLTGQKKYLACAQLIVDRRGTEPKRQSIWNMKPGIDGTDVIQDRVPVRSSKEVVGHNVFFTYLYTGAADLCAETKDDKLAAALDRLWNDLTGRKMFIHGGVSAHPVTISNGAVAVEAAGAPYQLPNGTCYNETCGQIGVFMWGHRMLVNQPNSHYADIMEREMFNGFLPCIGLEGRSWFYRAVLRRYDAGYQSSGWNDMVQRQKPGRKELCCPSNLLRTLAQLAAYFYSRDEAGLWIHHYGGNKLTCKLAGGQSIALEQITDYPWSGEVKIVIKEAPVRPIALRLRLPAWAGGATAATGTAAASGATATDRAGKQGMPGGATVSINGVAVASPILERGYLTLTQSWKPGDTIALSLPFDAQLITADPRVEETRNQVAVMRGPVLYCLESPDLPEGTKSVADIHLPGDATFTPTRGLPGSKEPLAGGNSALAQSLICLEGTVLQRSEEPWTTLYRPLGRPQMRPVRLRLIPYFAWCNRGPSAMTVWMPVVLKKP